VPGQLLGIRLSLPPPAETESHLAELADLASAVYPAPPWRATPTGVTRLVDRLADDSARCGFVLVLAHDAQHNLVGFAYGRPARHLAALAGRPPTTTPLPFELRELAVAPRACGHGVGSALHDTLTAATPPGPRWLITHPHAAPALALYRSRGWQTARILPAPDQPGSVRLLMHRLR
jgi:ribosomal protein S18 acetylase RimI-like enzyme